MGIPADFASDGTEDLAPQGAFTLVGVFSAPRPGAVATTDSGQVSRLDAIPIEYPPALLAVAVGLFLIGVFSQAMIEARRLHAATFRAQRHY